MLLVMTSRPMKTMTTVSTGEFSTGLTTMRSIRTPAAKEKTSVRKNAAQ
jgi:hypothetical protein